MAMVAAKGRLPDSAPQETLEGAKSRHTTKRTSVEKTTVTKLRANGVDNIVSLGSAFEAMGVAFVIQVRLSR
jgi:hypothetical protein